MTPREILEEVKRRIVADPGTYRQDTFCGTQSCIAGHIDAILHGVDVHNRRPNTTETVDFINKTALAAIGEETDTWLFGQINDDVPGDDIDKDEIQDYWPQDLSICYEDATTPLGRAAVGCEAIDRYIKERGL